jgi:Holliday junction resolvase
MLELQSESQDANSALRHALKGLAHELYFKKPHFPKHQSYYSRAMHDADNARLDDPNSVEINGANDPVTELLLKAMPDRDDYSSLLEDWECAESTINCRTKAFLGLLGSIRTAELFDLLLPNDAPFAPLYLAKEGFGIVGRIDREIGQPDMVLFGGNTVLLIEMKVRGGKAKAKYDVDQLCKYLSLASVLRTKLNQDYRFIHCLLAPLRQDNIIKNRKAWIKNKLSHAIAIEVDSAMAFDLITRSTRHARLGKSGGADWIAQELLKTPLFLLDFSEFTELARKLPYNDNNTDQEARRQLDAIIRFGL